MTEVGGSTGSKTAILKVNMEISYIIMWINLRISTKFLQISPETLKSHQILTKIGHLVGFLTFFPKSDHCSVLDIVDDDGFTLPLPLES